MAADSESYLVTGALGCVGAWTIRLLLERGANVVALDAGTDRSRLDLVLAGLPADGLELRQVDITDLGAVQSALDDFDVTHILHLAALQVPFCAANPPLGAEVNVVGTVNVFEAVKQARSRVVNVVYAGSMAMFSPADADPTTGVLPTDAEAHPKTHYGVFKQANEETARVYWEIDRIPSVSLRPYVIYGPGRDQGLTSTPTMAMLAAVLGRPFAIDFDARMQIQFAPDVASAFLAASRVDDGAHAASLGGPVVTNSEIVAELEQVLPDSRGLISVGSGDLPFPDSAEDRAARELLGELPQSSLREGIELTVEHFSRLRDADELPESLLAKLA